MTGHPEAVLAREMRMCYSAVALVTDMDAGVEAGEGVGQAEVFAMFAANIERLKGILAAVLGDLPVARRLRVLRVGRRRRPDLRRPMRVLLTGAAGFIGGAIRRELDAAGHEVVLRGRAAAAGPPRPARGRGPARARRPRRRRLGRPARRHRRGLPPGRARRCGRRRWPTCPSTPPTTTSAPPRCWPRCPPATCAGWCSPRRWSSTARAATSARRTARSRRRPGRSRRSSPATSTTTAPRAARRWAGSWSTSPRGSTRAARTPPARSPRSTTRPRGPGRATRAAVALRYHNVYGPGHAAGHAVLRRRRDLPLVAGARGGAAGLRGRRPDARLRARRRRRPRQPRRDRGRSGDGRPAR